MSTTVTKKRTRRTTSLASLLNTTYRRLLSAIRNTIGTRLLRKKIFRDKGTAVIEYMFYPERGIKKHVVIDLTGDPKTGHLLVTVYEKKKGTLNRLLELTIRNKKELQEKITGIMTSVEQPGEQIAEKVIENEDKVAKELLAGFRARYGMHRDVREFLDELVKRYKTPREKALALLEKIAEDYGFTSDSRLVKLARNWLESIKRGETSLKEALEDIISYLGLKEYGEALRKAEAEAIKEVARREYVKEELKKGRHRTLRGIREGLKEYYPELYERLAEFPEALEYVVKGLEKLFNLPQSDLEKLAIEIKRMEMKPSARKYYTDEDFRELSNSYIRRILTEKSPKDKIDALADLFGDLSYLLAYAYVLGKHGKVDLASIRRELQRYKQKIIDALSKEMDRKIIDLHYKKSLFRVMGSNQYPYTKQLPMYMYLDILFNTKKGKKLIDYINRLSPTYLGNILLNLVRREEHWKRRTAEYQPEFVYHVLDNILVAYNRLASLDNIIHMRSEKEFLDNLAKALGFPGPSVGPVSLRAKSLGEGRFRLEVFLNGRKILEKDYDLSEIAKNYGPDYADYLFTSIKTDVEDALAKNRIFIESGKRGEKPVFYRKTKEGYEIIYPEKRLYRWDDPELIRKYADEYDTLVMSFKSEAKEHGIGYPSMILDAYEWIEHIRSPRIELARGKKYYLVVGPRGLGERFYEGNTLEELLKKVEKDILNDNIQPKYVPKLIEILRKHGHEIKMPAGEKELFEEAMKIGRAIKSTLSKAMKAGYIDPSRMLLVSNRPLITHVINKERFREKQPVGVEDMYVVDRFSGKHVPLARARVRDINPHTTCIAVKFDGEENYYPPELGLIIKRYGRPKEIYVYGKDMPIELVYDKIYVAIAPIMP